MATSRRIPARSWTTRPDPSACTLAQSEKSRAVGVAPPFGLPHPSSGEIKDEATGEVLNVIQDNDPDRPPDRISSSHGAGP